MTPLILQSVLGAFVPLDAVGIAFSTVQVVLLPIAVGVFLNKVVPKFCRFVEPASPVVGVIISVLLIGASVSQCADAILQAGPTLQLALILLHLVGGGLGYAANRVLGFDQTTCRTAAIETAMKSAAFAYLVACLHFNDPLVRVPAAISTVVMSVVGSSMAVLWRFMPVSDGSKK